MSRGRISELHELFNDTFELFDLLAEYDMALNPSLVSPGTKEQIRVIMSKYLESCEGDLGELGNGLLKDLLRRDIVEIMDNILAIPISETEDDLATIQKVTDQAIIYMSMEISAFEKSVSFISSLRDRHEVKVNPNVLSHTGDITILNRAYCCSEDNADYEKLIKWLLVWGADPRVKGEVNFNVLDCFREEPGTIEDEILLKVQHLEQEEAQKIKAGGARLSYAERIEGYGKKLGEDFRKSTWQEKTEPLLGSEGLHRS